MRVYFLSLTMNYILIIVTTILILFSCGTNIENNERKKPIENTIDSIKTTIKDKFVLKGIKVTNLHMKQILTQQERTITKSNQ